MALKEGQSYNFEGEVIRVCQLIGWWGVREDESCVDGSKLGKGDKPRVPSRRYVAEENELVSDNQIFIKYLMGARVLC